MYRNHDNAIRRERQILRHNTTSTQHGKDVTKVQTVFLTDSYNQARIPDTLYRIVDPENLVKQNHVIVSNSVEIYLRDIMRIMGEQREFYRVSIDLKDNVVHITSEYDRIFYIRLRVDMDRDSPKSLTVLNKPVTYPVKQRRR